MTKEVNPAWIDTESMCKYLPVHMLMWACVDACVYVYVSNRASVGADRAGGYGRSGSGTEGRAGAPSGHCRQAAIR